MTPVERQIVERLHAYAGGLAVNQTDVQHAHDELRDRLGARSHHRTRRVALAAAVVALIVAAFVLRPGTDRSAPIPADTTPSTSPQRAPDGLAPTVIGLTGIWLDARDRTLLRFGADGTYSFDDAWHVGNQVAIYGTYQTNGRVITFHHRGGYLCRARESSTWLAGLPEPGLLRLVVTSAAPECTDKVGDRHSLTRVSPQSPAGARITSAPGARRLITATDAGQVYGVWLQQGTGRLLRLAPPGTYTLDDSGDLAVTPDDHGSFTVNGQGQLLLTSESGSRDCAPGDRTTLQRVRLATNSLSLGSQQGTCQGRPDLAGTWLRLT